MTTSQNHEESLLRERKALATFIANFRKMKKVSDPIEYAKNCKALVNLYGSAEEVAKKLEIGKETVRILSRIPELPSEVQDLISKRKIPITVAFDLVPLTSARQVETARAIVGLPFKDARNVIRRASKNPQKPAAVIRSEVLNEMEKQQVNVAMIALPREICALLLAESKDVPLLISHIIDEWLAKNGSLDYSYSINKQDLVSLAITLSRTTFMALSRKTRKPANLVEQIVFSWLRQKGKIT